LSETRAALEKLRTSFDLRKNSDFQSCIEAARKQFEYFFNFRIKNLLHLLPKDGKDKLGNLFWSGTKRLPEPVTFDPSDPLHVKFITATANLIALNFNIKQERDTDIIASMAAKIQVEEFKMRNIKVDLPDGEVK
jgi:ubiquitin-activating enzyme E1